MFRPACVILALSTILLCRGPAPVTAAQRSATWTLENGKLNVRLGDFPSIVLPSPSYNASFSGDPVPGIVKELEIQYKIDGKAGEVVFPENATIMLPLPE